MLLDLDAPYDAPPASAAEGAEQLRAALYPDDDAPPAPGPPPADAAEPDHGPADPHADQVVLFKFAGVEYWVDADPDAAILLRFMWNSRTGDELGAVTDLLLALLGEDQFKVLADTTGLRKRHFARMVQAAIQHLAGEDEAAPKGRTARQNAGRGGRG